MNSIFTQTNITIARLQAFMEVVEAGTIAAATSTGTTKQSQYSRQIKELEDSLGMTLFNRSKGRMSLSFNGQQLSGIVSAFADALQDLVDEQTTANRMIRIGAGNSVYQWMLLPISKELQTQLPLVSLEFHNLRSRDIIDKLQKGEIDLGIARKQDRAKVGAIEPNPIRTLRFALFYKKDQFSDPTVKKLLSSGRLIGLSGGGSIWRKTRELMESNGLEPHLWMRFDSMPMVANALKQTDGVAILPHEAQSELAEFGYEMLSHNSLKTFDRSFFLHLNSRVAAMRPPLARSAEKLALLLA